MKKLYLLSVAVCLVAVGSAQAGEPVTVGYQCHSEFADASPYPGEFTVKACKWL